MSQSTEKLVLWRGLGSVPSLFPGAYYALCVTNRRIMVLNLSEAGGLGADAPLLALGGLGFLFGFRLGKAQAQRDAERIRQLPFGEMPQHCPGSLVVPFADLTDVEVAGQRLTITTQFQRAVYQFEGLNGAHGRQFRDLMYAARDAEGGEVMD